VKKIRKVALTAGIAAGLFASAPSWGGAILKIDDDSSIDLGFRVQAYSMMTDTDLNGDGSWDDETDFRVRRARLRAKLTVNQYVSAFIQTEAADDPGGSGSDMRVIDSWVNLKYGNWVQLFAGQHMSPASRQTVTGSGAMMAIDRPGNNTKNLTWGARALSKFSTTTYGDSNDPFIVGDNAVRDVGLTFFGTGSFSDSMHLKYYAGVYDGVQNTKNVDLNDDGTIDCAVDFCRTDDDNLRTTVRAQLNFFDAEPGYFNNSTYLGKKRTIGIGASYDSQDEVENSLNNAGSPNGYGDYEYWSVDAFMDWPLGPGALTAEAAYSELDLDDATQKATQSQGDGWYFQTGYYINKWQPWFEMESWSSDDSGDLGSYDSYRIGISYFFKGHNANVKIGYESFEPEENFSGTSEDTIETFLLGFYTTF
jgi:hypothetical protein